jgi:iron(II)-dependent oxidoreductase
MGYRIARYVVLLSAILSHSCSLPTQSGKSIALDDVVLIPAGWFTMGSDIGPASNQPAHLVYISAFEIDRFEVTNNEFAEYVEITGNYPKAWSEEKPTLPPEYPVVGILWREADRYCTWRNMRLPTEAEWEKAARGINALTFPWGNDWDQSRANVIDAGFEGPVEVDMYPTGQSPYGVYNMIGNVEEWVSDYFDPDYYKSSPCQDPKGPTKVLDHVLRGGSWASRIEHASAIFRNSSHSVLPNYRVGFRCVSEVDT